MPPGHIPTPAQVVLCGPCNVTADATADATATAAAEGGLPRGRVVHATTTAAAVNAFIEGGHTAQICFRCGETGHLRHQCLNYKVRMCYHHTHGGCHDTCCTFAHGEEELRTPWKSRCVRVVKQWGTFVCIGCNATDHTFRRCPLYRDMPHM